MKRTLRYWKLKIHHWLYKLTHKIYLPGFEGLSLYEVSSFFVRRLHEGELQVRARSTAFSFLLALFPGIIFLFTLIAYIPVKGFQDEVMNLIRTILPYNAYEASRVTIEEIVRHQNGSLLSLGFLLALWVSTDGILSLITWFNRSYHGHARRSPFRQRVMAMGLTFFLTLIVFLAIGLIIATSFIRLDLSELSALEYFTNVILVQTGKWIILLTVCFFAISILYFAGPARSEKLRFISAGATLATILIVLTSLGFKFFIENFGQYNKIYGSIGTLIVILIWIYINSLVVLIGYELNMAIRKVKKSKHPHIIPPPHW